MSKPRFSMPLDDLKRSLRDFENRHDQTTTNVHKSWMSKDVFPETQRIVPVDTGLLKATGKVVVNESRDVSIWYGDPTRDGGPGVDYAAAVHEIIRARHEAPTQAKYVETPLFSMLPRLRKKLRAGIMRAKKGAF
jgi:hypothetical protein